jgi:kynurenine formamidase
MPFFPYTLIDLAHELSSATPIWDGGCGFEHHIHFDYAPAAEYKFRVHKINMNEGIGTHMDAPAHCIPDGKTIDELQLSNLVAPCAVIDVSARSHERYCVSVQDIKDFEKSHGLIQ